MQARLVRLSSHRNPKSCSTHRWFGLIAWLRVTISFSSAFHPQLADGVSLSSSTVGRLRSPLSQWYDHHRHHYVPYSEAGNPLGAVGWAGVGYLISGGWSVITTINQSVFHLCALCAFACAKGREEPWPRRGRDDIRGECRRGRQPRGEREKNRRSWRATTERGLVYTSERGTEVESEGVRSVDPRCSTIPLVVSRLGLSGSRSIKFSQWDAVFVDLTVLLDSSRVRMLTCENTIVTRLYTWSVEN